MKIVYSYYVMDLLHTGHILMLKNSKAIAGPDGRLVVGIVSDEAVEKTEGKSPSFEFPRAIGVSSINPVCRFGRAAESNIPRWRILRRIKPDILMESESHSDAQLSTCRDLMKSIGGQTIIMPYYDGQSSTMIKNKVITESNSPQ